MKSLLHTRETLGRVVGRSLVVCLMSAGLVLGLAACGGSSPSSSSATSSSIPSSTSASTQTQTSSSTISSTTIVYEGKSKEEYEASIPELQKKLESAPDDLETLQDLAIAQYGAKQYEAAAATYEKMLALKDDPFTRNNYANVLRDWGKTDEAKTEYQKALDADPTLTVAYINLANVLLREGKKEEALALLDKGIASTQGEDKTRLESFKEQVSKSE